MQITKKKESRQEKRKKLAVRILCIFLAGLMVLGMAYYIIVMLTYSVKAGETAVIDSSALSDERDVKVSVGLYYGSDVGPEFEITSSNGFYIGTQELSGEKKFEKIWELGYYTRISATSDANLGLKGNDYYITNDVNSTVIGGFHVQIDCDDLDYDEFMLYYDSVRYMLSIYGLSVIPCYIYTGYAIRIGHFSTWNAAYQYYEDIAAMFEPRTVSVVNPSYTAISVIDPYNAEILFEFDCGNNEVIGFRANEDVNGNTYMKTPAGYSYDGTFAFKRYVGGVNDGVTLINVVPLEAYIAGVLPYEISNSWPIEVQKEFAIAARSFTLTHLGSAKHKSDCFDLCNTDCCEVYRGAGRVNEEVMEAVLGTKGMVICYEGEIVSSYYSSTVGGVTVSAADCWGGKDVPYLQATETPWEDYMNHANGLWISEVSPTDLRTRLNKAGYTQLQGEIVDVTIEELAKNSTYVKKLKATDSYGNSATITYTDNVRTSLTPYVNSANFVVGRGEVKYTEWTPVSHTEDNEDTETIEESEDTDTEDNEDVSELKLSGLIKVDEMYVVTGDSYNKIDYIGYVNVITADGEYECSKQTIYAATSETAAAYAEAENVTDEPAEEPEENSEENPGEKPEENPEENLENNTDPTLEPEEQEQSDDVTESDSGIEYKVAYANDRNNFIFVGKGWGHGVGMSQWGAYDLAMQGKTYDEIVKAYFPSVSIVNYRMTDNFKESEHEEETE